MFVIITRNFPPDVGGIQSLMEGLSLSLAEHGSVKVFADNFPDCSKYDQKSNLDITRVKGFKIIRKFRKSFLINGYLKKNNIKGVFFDHWKSLELIKDEYLKKIPNFCLIHSKEINHLPLTLLNNRMNKAFKKAKFIIANSEYTKNLAITMGIEKKKIHIINPGTNYPIEIENEEEKKAKKIFSSSFPNIITIARLDRRKNHQNILMTIKNLIPIFPNIKYVCIGDGEEKNNLEKLKINLGLEKEVIFLSNVNEKLKVALLSNANLFLMPSIIYKKSVEGFGISFVESGTYSVGSIGGIAGGEADAIKDGVTGFLCDGNNLGSIYETVLKFFKNDNYKIMGLQAKNFSQKFKWNIIIKKYLFLI